MIGKCFNIRLTTLHTDYGQLVTRLFILGNFDNRKKAERRKRWARVKAKGEQQSSTRDIYAEALPDLRQIVKEREAVRHSPEILPKQPSRLETAATFI
jgi:hypothetical protein